MKHLAIYPILVALCYLCLMSCSKQESVTPLDPMIEKVNHCGCDDAIQQLEWLRNTVIFMETHRGDIHAEICTCKYDEGKDVEFYGDKATAKFCVPAGHFAVFFPEDAHQPGIAPGKVYRKIIVKAKVQQ